MRESEYLFKQRFLTQLETKKVKNFTPKKPLAFWLHFLIQGDQNHYSNLTSKIK